MSIDFSEVRWQKVINNYEAWWQGSLERPLVPLVVDGRDPGRPLPSAPLLTQATVTDLTIPPEALVDRLDYELSSLTFLGDAFPMVDFEMFGPGVVAAFLGACVDNSTGRVWFHMGKKPIEELHFSFDPDNVWLRRIEAIYSAGMEYWHGNVLMGMPDLGGVLDILATFLTTEGLLLDLYDCPEEVHRLADEIKEAWHQFHSLFSDLLSGQRGYTDWSSLYSKKKSYIIQSDVSYMLGPDMFDEFALPEIRETCRKLPRTIYHLDGVGELKHLDKLLAIPELDGVQWIPGDGQKHPGLWPEVYEKIHDSGKRMQIVGYDALRPVMECLGTGRGISVRQWNHFAPSEEERLRRELCELGID